MGGLSEQPKLDPSKCEHIWLLGEWFWRSADGIPRKVKCRICGTFKHHDEIKPQDIRWAEEAMKSDGQQET